MQTIGVREIKTRISEILRRVEAGEWFVVTNQGREVAELGPRKPRQWRRWDQVAEVFDGPPDPALMDDLARLGGGELTNPWDHA